MTSAARVSARAVVARACRRLPRAVLALLLGLMVALAAGGVTARAASSGPALPAIPTPALGGSADKTPRPPDDPAKVADFVGRLDDRQARAVLLDTLSQHTPAAATDRESLGEVFGEASRQLQDAGSRFGLLVSATTEFGQVRRLLTIHLGMQEGAFDFCIRLLAVALAALLAEFLAVAIISRLARRARHGRAAGAVTLSIRVAGFVAFSAMAVIVAVVLSEGLQGEQQRLLLRLAVAFWAVRGADMVAHAGIASFAGRGSLLRRGGPRYPLAFSAAHATLAFGAVALGVMREAGIDHDVRLLIGLALWTLLAGLILGGLAHLRRILPSPDEDAPPTLSAWLAEHWLGLAATVVCFVWLSTLLVAVGAGIRALRAGALTMLLVSYAPALMHVVSSGLRWLMTRDDPRRGSDRIWATALVRCSRIVVLILIALALSDIWDIDPIGLASDRLGEATVRTAIHVLFIVLSAYVVWELVKALVRGNAVSQERAEQEASEEIGAVQPASRIQTFLPLVEKFLLAVVIVVATLAVMKAVGVDTGPLLAGAGIAGIAIGFGAQTLVRDIVSGIFFLFDDAFRLGEYVEIDQTRGTVEGISIRSLRIRHHRGAIHTVPFGTIQRLTNYSRDWIILKLEFLLAFDTDLQKVKKIVRQIGQEMLDDPELGQHFLEPVKSQGVRRMEQIGMVVGVKFMAKPGEQFILRREVYHRVRDAFEENGIRFAQPQVVVQMPSGATRTLEPDEADLVAAAAGEAVTSPPPVVPEKKKAGGKR